jgi:hypothetical protein
LAVVCFLLAICPCRSPCSCSSRARAGIGPCRTPCTCSYHARPVLALLYLWTCSPARITAKPRAALGAASTAASVFVGAGASSARGGFCAFRLVRPP